MKTQDIREMDERKLAARLNKLRADYLAMLEDVRSGKEKNHGQLKVLKRSIARVQTIAHEKLHSL